MSADAPKNKLNICLQHLLCRPVKSGDVVYMSTEEVNGWSCRVAFPQLHVEARGDTARTKKEGEHNAALRLLIQLGLDRAGSASALTGRISIAPAICATLSTDTRAAILNSEAAACTRRHQKKERLQAKMAKQDRVLREREQLAVEVERLQDAEMIIEPPFKRYRAMGTASDFAKIIEQRRGNA